MTTSMLPGAVPGLLELAALVVGLVLVSRRTGGARRTYGLLGLGVMAVVTVLRTGALIAFPLFYSSIGSAFATAYSVISAVLTLVWIGGLVLVVVALVARDPGQSYPSHPGPPQR